MRHSSFVTWKRFSKYFRLILSGLGNEIAKMVVHKSELNLRVAPVGMEPLRVQNRKSAQVFLNILSFRSPENVQGGFIFAQILEIWLGFY